LVLGSSTTLHLSCIVYTDYYGGDYYYPTTITLGPAASVQLDENANLNLANGATVSLGPNGFMKLAQKATFKTSAPWATQGGYTYSMSINGQLSIGSYADVDLRGHNPNYPLNIATSASLLDIGEGATVKHMNMPDYGINVTGIFNINTFGSLIMGDSSGVYVAENANLNIMMGIAVQMGANSQLNVLPGMYCKFLENVNLAASSTWNLGANNPVPNGVHCFQVGPGKK
jgi:hypothetical protein